MCLDAMSGARRFSTFDLRRSYHQVAMEEEDSDKTAFVCCEGQIIQVQDHAFWTVQRWSYVPTVDGHGDVWTSLRGVPGLPGWRHRL